MHNLQQDLKHTTQERNELLVELKRIDHNLDEGRRTKHTLETTLKEADRHISEELEERKKLTQEIVNCQKEKQQLQQLLEKNQHQTLQLTKETITNSNVINEWKHKYKTLENLHSTTVQQQEAVSGTTNNNKVTSSQKILFVMAIIWQSLIWHTHLCCSLE